MIYGSWLSIDTPDNVVALLKARSNGDDSY